jgi:hypothetical protein
LGCKLLKQSATEEGVKKSIWPNLTAKEMSLNGEKIDCRANIQENFELVFASSIFSRLPTNYNNPYEQKKRNWQWLKSENPAKRSEG